jgi:hypothetical protein
MAAPRRIIISTMPPPTQPTVGINRVLEIQDADWLYDSNQRAPLSRTTPEIPLDRAQDPM